MLDLVQLRQAVVRPVLDHLGLHSPAAENLLIGTALQESQGGTYLRQLGGGPALGVYQMEPATHDDIWANFLVHRPGVAERVGDLASRWPSPRAAQLVTSIAYATAMARIHYYRVPAPLPAAADIPALAQYWKAHYNTAAGGGTVAEWVMTYSRFAKT